MLLRKATRVRVNGDLFHGRVPAGAVYAGRPAPGLPGSPWANPFKPGKRTPPSVALGGEMWLVDPLLVGGWPPGRAAARDWYRVLVARCGLEARIVAELAGQDIACWCALTEPCHVDVLVDIANGWQS